MVNPYAGCTGTWVRGNLHGHCAESSGCSSVPLLAGVEKHYAAGARFLAITDHDMVTDLSAARSRWPDVTFLEGFEWSRSENILFIGEKVLPLYELDLPEALRQSSGLLTVICHPRPHMRREYWTIPMIMALDPAPLAVEVYNSHYSRPLRTDAGPNPLYSDTWDALLTRGLRVWGFANDDSHNPGDFGHTATWANVPDKSAASMMRALRAGRFYASTGLRLLEVSVANAEIRVRLDSEAQGRFVGPGGAILGAALGREFSLRAGDQDYIRFEAEGAEGRIFLQPFFRAA
jgi:hypothetical protein